MFESISCFFEYRRFKFDIIFCRTLGYTQDTWICKIYFIDSDIVHARENKKISLNIISDFSIDKTRYSIQTPEKTELPISNFWENQTLVLNNGEDDVLGWLCIGAVHEGGESICKVWSRLRMIHLVHFRSFSSISAIVLFLIVSGSSKSSKSTAFNPQCTLRRLTNPLINPVLPW